MGDELLAAVRTRYSAAEFPTLWWQYENWRASRPLAGLTVLDATPVFGNTLAKYLALRAAGAGLTVGVNPGLPSDPDVVARVAALGIPVTQRASGGFDIVLDCAGLNAGVAARLGYAELTRSGVDRYEGSNSPVVSVDSGAIKRIETTLGTSDGFIRAMAHLGHPIPTGASVVIFGLGKVGTGVAHAAALHEARITAIDPNASAAAALGEVAGTASHGVVDAGDEAQVDAAIAGAWCVVAATGVAGALDPFADALIGSRALLANMGAEDEFGPRVPPGRALNGKVPVNFALDQPTLLRYLDATMALSNACAVELAHGRIPPGLHAPAPALESQLLRITVDRGLIADELATLRGVTY